MRPLSISLGILAALFLSTPFAGSEPVKNVNKNNAVHAIVFEAVAVAISLEEPELMAMGVALLAKFLSVGGEAAHVCGIHQPPLALLRCTALA